MGDRKELRAILTVTFPNQPIADKSLHQGSGLPSEITSLVPGNAANPNQNFSPNVIFF
jgi:hypothetical protein